MITLPFPVGTVADPLPYQLLLTVSIISITISRELAALYATETLNGPLCGIVTGERAMTRISLPVDPPEDPVPVVDPEGPVVAVPVVALAVVVPVVAGAVVAVPVVALPVVEGPVVEVPLATLASQQVVYGASPELKIQYHWKVYVLERIRKFLGKFNLPFGHGRWEGEASST